MAKQANHTMIGGFVVLAVILLAVSLVIFGSGKFFKKTNKFVLYFDESIKGLAVGAPVLFQGVQVGSVSEIVIRADFRKLKADIPVYIEVEPDRFQVVGTEFQDRKPGDLAPRLIELGLRATLTMQSSITGQLLIELDFHPNTPVVLRHLDPGMIEIPLCRPPAPNWPRPWNGPTSGRCKRNWKPGWTACGSSSLTLT